MLGLEGDARRYPKVHGGPERAVCLFSVELIETLNAEGHTLVPGSVGETITMRGIDWSRMGSGVRLHVGKALIEVTTPATTCRAIRRCFKDEDFNRVSPQTHPEMARYYGRVLTPAELTVGDEVSFASMAERQCTDASSG